MDLTQVEQWRLEIAGCNDIGSFNRLIVPVMKERGSIFLNMAVTEARARRYRADKDIGLYVEMHRAKGRNLVLIGWLDGSMYATFASGPRLYKYPHAPEEELAKILRNPFPDKIFHSNIKSKYSCIVLGEQKKIPEPGTMPLWVD